MKNMSKYVLAAVAAVSLSACGVDDVQMNGKLFDALGVNTSSVERKTPELKPRSGIVVPPNLSSLPEPGTGKAEAPDIAEVEDYDAKRSKPRELLEKEQAEYCAKHYDMAKAMGNQDTELIEGPLGRCQKSVLSLTEWGKNNQQGEDN